MKNFSAAVLTVCLVCVMAGDLQSQENKAEGTVESINFMENSVSIKLPDGETIDVTVGNNTEIFFEKEKTTLDTIGYGENIWASYKKVDGKNEALRIILTPPAEKDETEMPPQIM